MKPLILLTYLVLAFGSFSIFTILDGEDSDDPWTIALLAAFWPLVLIVAGVCLIIMTTGKAVDWLAKRILEMFILLIALLLSGCTNYSGPSIGFQAGYEGVSVGVTIFGQNPVARIPATPSPTPIPSPK